MPEWLWPDPLVDSGTAGDPSHDAARRMPIEALTIGGPGDRRDARSTPQRAPGHYARVELRRTSEDEVTATFSYAEAFVLFDVLQRWEDEDVSPPSRFQDPAERRVLWDLSASLEPMLSDALSQDYIDALEHARAAVRDAP